MCGSRGGCLSCPFLPAPLGKLGGCGHRAQSLLCRFSLSVLGPPWPHLSWERGHRPEPFLGTRGQRWVRCWNVWLQVLPLTCFRSASLQGFSSWNPLFQGFGVLYIRIILKLAVNQTLIKKKLGGGRGAGRVLLRSSSLKICAEQLLLNTTHLGHWSISWGRCCQAVPMPRFSSDVCLVAGNNYYGGVCLVVTFYFLHPFYVY